LEMYVDTFKSVTSKIIFFEAREAIYFLRGPGSLGWKKFLTLGLQTSFSSE
jgi:hypothetical protein